MKLVIRLCALFTLACVLAGCGIRQPSLTRVNDDYFVVTHPLVYETNDKTQRIEVPIGFLTDLASIPKGLWWFVSPFEAVASPAIIHDYLYWVQACSKDESDLMLFLAMNETGLNSFKKGSVFLGVNKSKKAQAAWDENRDAKAKGESRFLSVDYTRELQNANVKPGLKLSTIYKEAGPKGIVHPPVDPSVKKACLAAASFRDL